MASLELVYIIPPYLLQTSIGLKLQQSLKAVDEELGSSNVVSTLSPKYVIKQQDAAVPYNQFTDDPVINQIIKEKLFYKFSILGVLPNNLTDRESVSDERLFELWNIFKQRLVSDKASGEDQKAAPSRFSSDKFGEVFFSNDLEKVPEEYAPLLDNVLKDLLLNTKLRTWHSYRLPPSFIKVDSNRFWDYSLPISWVPFMAIDSLEHLEQQYSLSVNNDLGVSTIRLTSETAEATEPGQMGFSAKYFNFITDKPVHPSTGVFYYEVEIVQEATSASDFVPLIEINDAAVSSETSLHVSMGYTKASVDFEAQSASGGNTVTDKTKRIDLETLKSEIFYRKQNQSYDELNEKVDKYLSQKPGVLRGSYVVDFEDLKFHNSVRAAEAVLRSNVLNMTRRLSQLSRQTAEELDNGSIDIEVPFDTTQTKLKNKKIFKTDVVGYGINFINKTLFITLNGIRVKTISSSDIVCRNPAGDNLFDDSVDNSVYPLIGMELKDNLAGKGSDNPSISEVRANFGFKEFKFNISSYVKKFKMQKQKQLYITQLDKVRDKKPPTTSVFKDQNSETIEKLLTNLHDDPTLVHDLIKGYLNYEGYLTTYDAFNEDLKILVGEIQEDTIVEDSDEKEEDAKKVTYAYERQHIKNCLLKNQFDELIELINSKYVNTLGAELSKSIIFEIKYTKYIYLLMNYLEVKRKLQNYEFDFEYIDGVSEEDLFRQALQWGQSLQTEYKGMPLKVKRIHEVSKVLLVSDLENFPKIKYFVANYARHLKTLIGDINQQILTALGLREVSDIEATINGVHININKLSLEHEDEDFVLINYEQDYIDL